MGLGSPTRATGMKPVSRVHRKTPPPRRLLSRTKTAIVPESDSAGRPAKIGRRAPVSGSSRSEEHTSELQSRPHLVCRLLLEKKKAESSTVLLAWDCRPAKHLA